MYYIISAHTDNKIELSELVLDLLHSPRLPSHIEYVIYLDAFDSLMLGDADHIVDSFRDYDVDMLIGATYLNFPKNKKLR